MTDIKLPDEIIMRILSYTISWPRTVTILMRTCTQFTAMLSEILLDANNVNSNHHESLEPSAAISAFGKVCNYLKIIVCKGAKCNSLAAKCKLHVTCDACSDMNKKTDMVLIEYTTDDIYICSACSTRCNICYKREIVSYRKNKTMIGVCKSCDFNNHSRCVKCGSASFPRKLRRAIVDGLHRRRESNQMVFGCSECTVMGMYECGAQSFEPYSNY